MPSPLPKKKITEKLTEATSPTIHKSNPNQMDFPEAMRRVIDGKKVTKLEWGNPEVVVWLDSRLKIKLEDGSTHLLIISDGDMLGTDWVEA